MYLASLRVPGTVGFEGSMMRCVNKKRNTEIVEAIDQNYSPHNLGSSISHRCPIPGTPRSLSSQVRPIYEQVGVGPSLRSTNKFVYNI
mgnify:FL=1|jgi:hypothetical protein